MFSLKVSQLCICQGAVLSRILCLCCHFIFSRWQEKWINVQNNKLRHMNFSLLVDTNTERGFYVRKRLKHTFIIHTTLLTPCHSDSYMTHSCLSGISELYLLHVCALTSLFQSHRCHVIYYTLVTKMNFISSNSFC